MGSWVEPEIRGKSKTSEPANPNKSSLHPGLLLKITFLVTGLVTFRKFWSLEMSSFARYILDQMRIIIQSRLLFTSGG